MEDFAYREQFDLEDEHWWFQGRRAVIWSLLDRAGIGSGLRILDAGCGTGRNLVEFGRLGQAQGVDPSPEAVEFCRQRGLQDVRLGALERLPFHPGAFDLLLATDVIEHVQDDVAALGELRRVAAPGACLLVTVPAYHWLWSQHDVDLHHFRRYTWRRLRARLAQTGWAPVSWSYFNSVLLAPIAAVRLAGNRRAQVDRNGSGAPADGERRADLRLTPPAINRVLQVPLRLEAGLIGRGLHLPAGVSIGAVCVAS